MKDVRLRIILAVLWIVLQFVNMEWLQPLIPEYPRVVEAMIFGVVAFIVLVLVWFMFKRPDCKCWDDMDDEGPDEGPDALPFPTIIDPVESCGDNIPGATREQVTEWQKHDMGPSFGHGGMNNE